MASESNTKSSTYLHTTCDHTIDGIPSTAPEAHDLYADILLG
jgi:hypothetical protein